MMAIMVGIPTAGIADGMTTMAKASTAVQKEKIKENQKERAKIKVKINLAGPKVTGRAEVGEVVVAGAAAAEVKARARKARARARAKAKAKVIIKEKVRAKEKTEKEKEKDQEKEKTPRASGATGFRTTGTRGPPVQVKVKDPTMAAGEDNPASGAKISNKIRTITGASPAKAKVMAVVADRPNSSSSSSTTLEVGTSLWAWDRKVACRMSQWP